MRQISDPPDSPVTLFQYSNIMEKHPFRTLWNECQSTMTGRQQSERLLCRPDVEPRLDTCCVVVHKREIPKKTVEHYLVAWSSIPAYVSRYPLQPHGLTHATPIQIIRLPVDGRHALYLPYEKKRHKPNNKGSSYRPPGG